MKRTLIIHPFLVAIFPILFLYVNNIDNFPGNEIIMLLLINSGLALVLWLFLSRLLKNKQKAGLLVSVAFFFFFSYGHFYDVLNSYDFLTPLYLDQTLFPFFALIFLLTTYFIMKSHRNLTQLTHFFNIVTAALVLMSFINIGIYWLSAPPAPQQDPVDLVEANPPVEQEVHPAATRPNIYYIILDAYGRADVLKENYGYDNTEFLTYLREKGFYVTDRSYANYAQTALSLTSSFNLDYLQNFLGPLDETSNDRHILKDPLHHNNVARFLKRQGYTFVAFSSGYATTEMTNADVYLENEAWSEFQNLLINTTPIPYFLEYSPTLTQNNLHRKRILYIFDEIPQTARLDPPLFVFAHILAPHPPFLFDEDGQPINDHRGYTLTDGSHYMRRYRADRADYIKNYKRQLAFINQKLMTTIDALLANSPTPPIIIIQGDHGPGSMLDWNNPDDTNTDFKERMAILNAYYLPDHHYEQLHRGISPVNSFRVIFNHYFDQNYPLLEDIAYFSSWPKPYKFMNVNNKIDAGKSVQHK
jgi:hypothetical protein